MKTLNINFLAKSYGCVCVCGGGGVKIYAIMLPPSGSWFAHLSDIQPFLSEISLCINGKIMFKKIHKQNFYVTWSISF